MSESEMSLLKRIRQALETNPDAVIVDVDEHISLRGPRSTWAHWIEFLVAPKKGLYTVDKLQEFGMGLIPPGLEPNSIYDFTEVPRASSFLYFEEKIGEERIITKKIQTLTDEELFNVAGFIDGKKTIDSDITKGYKRGICISLSPDEATARDVLKSIEEKKEEKKSRQKSLPPIG